MLVSEFVVTELSYNHHGVPELRGPEEGDPQVEWILIGSQNLSTGVLRLGRTAVKFFWGEMFRAGTHCRQTGVSPFKNP